MYKTPIIGLISTGNEVVSVDTVHLDSGKIRDSNKIMFQVLLREIGIEATDFGTVEDEP